MARISSCPNTPNLLTQAELLRDTATILAEAGLQADPVVGRAATLIAIAANTALAVFGPDPQQPVATPAWDAHGLDGLFDSLGDPFTDPFPGAFVQLFKHVFMRMCTSACVQRHPQCALVSRDALPDLRLSGWTAENSDTWTTTYVYHTLHALPAAPSVLPPPLADLISPAQWRGYTFKQSPAAHPAGQPGPRHSGTGLGMGKGISEDQRPQHTASARGLGGFGKGKRPRTHYAPAGPGPADGEDEYDAAQALALARRGPQLSIIELDDEPEPEPEPKRRRDRDALPRGWYRPDALEDVLDPFAKKKPTPAAFLRHADVSLWIKTLVFVHTTTLCDPNRSDSCITICATHTSRNGSDYAYSLELLNALLSMRILLGAPEHDASSLYSDATVHLSSIVRCAAIEHNHLLSSDSFRLTCTNYVNKCNHPTAPDGSLVLDAITAHLLYTQLPTDPTIKSRVGSQWGLGSNKAIGLVLLPWPEDPLFTNKRGFNTRHPLFVDVAKRLIDTVSNVNQLANTALSGPATRGSNPDRLATWRLYAFTPPAQQFFAPHRPAAPPPAHTFSPAAAAQPASDPEESRLALRTTFNSCMGVFEDRIALAISSAGENALGRQNDFFAAQTASMRNYDRIHQQQLELQQDAARERKAAADQQRIDTAAYRQDVLAMQTAQVNSPSLYPSLLSQQASMDTFRLEQRAMQNTQVHCLLACLPAYSL